MPAATSAVALALGAAALHAAWNILLKAAGDPLRLSARAMAAGTVLAAPFVGGAWLLAGRPGLPLPALPVIAVSGIVELAYFILLSTAYRRGELSVVYPIARGTAPALSVGAGFLVLGEHAGPLQVAGIALLLVGLWAVRRPAGSRAALVPAVLTGVAIATYTSLDRVGVRLGPAFVYAWVLNLWVAVLLWAWVAAHPGPEPAGAEPAGWRLSAAVGSAMWASYFLVLLALSIAPLVLVAPVREASILLVSAWGVWRLGERDRGGARLFGAAAVVAGVVLVAV